jgi:hypothetical protein
MNTYTNISERYGEQVQATIEDYRQLNPTGNFEETDDMIVEHLRSGVSVTVAVKDAQK